MCPQNAPFAAFLHRRCRLCCTAPAPAGTSACHSRELVFSDTETEMALNETKKGKATTFFSPLPHLHPESKFGRAPSAESHQQDAPRTLLPTTRGPPSREWVFLSIPPLPLTPETPGESKSSLTQHVDAPWVLVHVGFRGILHLKHTVKAHGLLQPRESPCRHRSLGQGSGRLRHTHPHLSKSCSSHLALLGCLLLPTPALRKRHFEHKLRNQTLDTSREGGEGQ